jgi:urea transporter
MTDPIMANNPTSYPDHYVQTVRTLLRFALIMMIVSLLSGILFQESSKKLPHQPVAEGFSRWDATVHLALVHGHAMMIGVLVPVALAGMLHLARACGGKVINPRPLALARRLYLPAAAATLALMLYKSYHILLSARWGKTDPQQIHDALFGGVTAVRHGVYGASHVLMAVGLGIFAWTLWRSLRKTA